jgi:predicted nucleic acid-binding protein
MIGVTFDTGALIALERSDRRVLALLARAVATDATITVPASVLAQVIREPARQVLISRLIRQPNTRVPPLDAAAAVQIGRLLAASRTSDVVDAHVVLCAREADGSIVTTDPQDLARLDPGARLVVL